MPTDRTHRRRLTWEQVCARAWLKRGEIIKREAGYAGVRDNPMYEYGVDTVRFEAGYLKVRPIAPKWPSELLTTPCHAAR